MFDADGFRPACVSLCCLLHTNVLDQEALLIFQGTDIFGRSVAAFGEHPSYAPLINNHTILTQNRAQSRYCTSNSDPSNPLQISTRGEHSTQAA